MCFVLRQNNRLGSSFSILGNKSQRYKSFTIDRERAHRPYKYSQSHHLNFEKEIVYERISDKSVIDRPVDDVAVQGIYGWSMIIASASSMGNR